MVEPTNSKWMISAPGGGIDALRETCLDEDPALDCAIRKDAGHGGTVAGAARGSRTLAGVEIVFSALLGRWPHGRRGGRWDLRDSGRRRGPEFSRPGGRWGQVLLCVAGS